MFIIRFGKGLRIGFRENNFFIFFNLNGTVTNWCDFKKIAFF